MNVEATRWRSIAETRARRSTSYLTMRDAGRIYQASGATATAGRLYHLPLRLLRWRELQDLFILSFGSWNKHKAPRLGASLAFYTLLSITPLLLVIVSVVGLVIGKSAAEADVAREMRDMVGPAGGKAVEAVLAASHSTAHGVAASAFGLL